MVTLRSQRDTGKSVAPETPDLDSLQFCKFMSYGLSWEKLVLPDKFGSALMGGGRREVKLRVSAGGAERRAWDVEVVRGKYGDVYLAGGWRKFARANGLDLGQLLFFRYDGAALVTVTVLEGIPYQDEEEDDGAERGSSPPAPTGSGSSGGGTAEEEGTDDPASSLFSVVLRKCHFGQKQQQYLVSVNVSCVFFSVAKWFLAVDGVGNPNPRTAPGVTLCAAQHVPLWFQEAHGYRERRKVVLRMRGKSWIVNLKHSKYSGQRIRTALRYGWYQFCVDNDLGLDDICIFHALPEPEDDHVLRVEVRRPDGSTVQ